MNTEKQKEIVDGLMGNGEEIVEIPEIVDDSVVPMTLEEQNISLLKETENLRTQMLEMAATFQNAIDKKTAEIIETKVDTGAYEEEMNREIDFCLKTQNGFVFKKLPQKQALQEMVDWFRPRKNKCVDTAVLNPDTNTNMEVNQDPVYIRLRKRDLGSGRYKTKLEVVPLWIAVDRVLQGCDVEIVSKAEYDKATEDRMVGEREFTKNYYNKRRLKAIESLAKMPDTM